MTELALWYYVQDNSALRAKCTILLAGQHLIIEIVLPYYKQDKTSVLSYR